MERERKPQSIGGHLLEVTLAHRAENLFILANFSTTAAHNKACLLTLERPAQSQLVLLSRHRSTRRKDWKILDCYSPSEGCICGFFARGAVESRSEGRDLGVVSQLNKEETQQFLEECQREAYNASHLQSGCKHCKHGVEVESTQYNLLIFRQTVCRRVHRQQHCKSLRKRIEESHVSQCLVQHIKNIISQDRFEAANPSVVG
eukprot:scaffold1767_cov178-Ochromonas_danica.AAC.30